MLRFKVISSILHPGALHCQCSTSFSSPMFSNLQTRHCGQTFIPNTAFKRAHIWQESAHLVWKWHYFPPLRYTKQIQVWTQGRDIIICVCFVPQFVRAEKNIWLLVLLLLGINTLLAYGGLCLVAKIIQAEIFRLERREVDAAVGLISPFVGGPVSFIGSRE